MRNTLKRIDLLQRSVAIPAASSTASSQHVEFSDFADSIGDMIAVVEAPALSATQLPNGSTITYSLVCSASMSLTSPASSVVLGVQTGAGGAGATAACFACRLATVGGRYHGLLITTSAGVNAAGVVETLQFGFTN